MDNGETDYFAVDVEAFASPLVVIPDMGGNANDYFLLRSRQARVEPTFCQVPRDVPPSLPNGCA